MNSTFSRILILVAVLCVSFTAVQAAEVRLVDGQLVVAGVDDSIGLGVFDVVLSYGPDISVTSVEPLSGFLVAKNIRNDKGMTIIAGISVDGLTGDIPVASVKVEGTGSIVISVRDLGNIKGDPIAFTNLKFSGMIPTSGSSTPESTSGSESATPASTQFSLPATTTVPVKALQPTEVGRTPALMTEATTIPTQVPPVESQETPERKTEAKGTPKAALPSLLAFSAILTVMILKRKG